MGKSASLLRRRLSERGSEVWFRLHCIAPHRITPQAIRIRNRLQDMSVGRELY